MSKGTPHLDCNNCSSILQPNPFLIQVLLYPSNVLALRVIVYLIMYNVLAEYDGYFPLQMVSITKLYKKWIQYVWSTNKTTTCFGYLLYLAVQICKKNNNSLSVCYPSLGLHKKWLNGLKSNWQKIYVSCFDFTKSLAWN